MVIKLNNLSKISIFIVSIISFYLFFALGNVVYRAYIGLNLCSGEGCGYSVLIVVPILSLIFAISSLLLIRFTGWRIGLLISIFILLFLVATQLSISAIKQYKESLNDLNENIDIMRQLAINIEEVRLTAGSRICFSGPNWPYSVNSLPDFDSRAEKVFHKEGSYKPGNGITAYSTYLRFKLFKISKDKIIDNVHVAIRPIKYSKEYLEKDEKQRRQAKGSLPKYLEKYVIYVYLDFDDSLELRREYNFTTNCDVWEVENIRNNSKGKPILVFSSKY